MSLKVIVSYDGTTHDDDALVLAKMIAATGATLELAYVRHTREYDPRREEIGAYDAARRLDQGALWLQDPDIARHIVVDPSTSAGLSKLAATAGRTADPVRIGLPHHAGPGRTGRRGPGPAGGRFGGDRRGPGGAADERG